MAKKTLTEPGLEPETSGLPYQRSNHLSYPALWMVAVPNSQLFFAGVGAPVRSIQPRSAVYLQGSHPRFHSIRTTIVANLATAVGDLTMWMQLFHFKVNQLKEN